jgi:hypothetical protein
MDGLAMHHDEPAILIRLLKGSSPRALDESLRLRGASSGRASGLGFASGVELDLDVGAGDALG